MENTNESKNDMTGTECKGECGKKPCENKDDSAPKNECNDKAEAWNWSKIKETIMCWNECGKTSDQNMYNMISLFCIAIIAACVVFISFSVMSISQNMEALVGFNKYFMQAS